MERLELIRSLGLLWGLQPRVRDYIVFFPRAEMRSSYEGVDGIVFSPEGTHLSIQFVRLIDREEGNFSL